MPSEGRGDLARHVVAYRIYAPLGIKTFSGGLEARRGDLARHVPRASTLPRPALASSCSRLRVLHVLGGVELVEGVEAAQRVADLEDLAVQVAADLGD
ncbi:MAG: hypothetical protein IPK80_19905 [Nannocystis sp.]|nr:hypothetical protein [Nannocystis sp.]